MSKDLTKKAAEMLLKGATLLKEPCPYCNGVRVMKDGNAFCVNCGKEPEKKSETQIEQKTLEPIKILEKKMQELTAQLEKETDAGKQQEILKSINMLIEIMKNIKNQQ